MRPNRSNYRPQMRAWHDYHITGYTVDGKNREIRFDISWPYETATDIERAVVVFSGVEGYFFEHDLGGNIVYAFSEESIEEFLAEHQSQFEESAKWGWPLFWAGSVSQSLEGLRTREAKCFELSSSYGLSGWLLATDVEYLEPENQPSFKPTGRRPAA